jgi:putative membrane protein
MDSFSAMISASVSGLPLFVLFAGTSLVLVLVFGFVYARVTPHSEFALMRQGNVAAAVSFGGAVLGFVIPLGRAVAQSTHILDMVVWAIVALVVQLLVFWIAAVALGGVSRKIEAGDLAAALFLALMSVAGGMINAACMTYTD